jgi:acetoacetyl-CoA synthetase
MHGRSDGVLNVRGIRVGPAEIYRILQDFEEIREAMAVEQVLAPGPDGSRLLLFVVLRPGFVLDDALTTRIKRQLARHGSPAHVPAVVASVPELPVTHSGKRSERAAYNAVNGLHASNYEALRNPECLRALSEHRSVRASAAP